MTAVTEFDRYWREKGPLIIAEIKALHPTASTIDALITQVLKRYTADLKPLLLSYFSKSYATKLIVLKSPLPKTFEVTNKLSTTINKHLNFPEIRRDIKAGFKASQSVAKIAQDLRDSGFSKAKLPGYLKDITDSARTTAQLAHDSKEYLKFKRQLNIAQKRINRLVDPDTSTLRRAYQDIIDKSTTYSKQSYDKTVSYAIKAKQKSQTERLVRNEEVRAYTQAATDDLKADTDAIGWRWILDTENACPLCDAKATQDGYGMGEGGYPKRITPEIPLHPGCRCSLEKIYR